MRYWLMIASCRKQPPARTMTGRKNQCRISSWTIPAYMPSWNLIRSRASALSLEKTLNIKFLGSSTKRLATKACTLGIRSWFIRSRSTRKITGRSTKPFCAWSMKRMLNTSRNVSKISTCRWASLTCKPCWSECRTSWCPNFSFTSFI